LKLLKQVASTVIFGQSGMYPSKYQWENPFSYLVPQEGESPPCYDFWQDSKLPKKVKSSWIANLFLPTNPIYGHIADV
jgi:hypothetical protein